MRFVLIICTAFLFAIGLVMIFSTTSADVLDQDLSRSHDYAAIKQSCFFLAGIGFAALIHKWGYRRFISFSPQLLWLFVIFLILALIPGIGREVNGSRRWLALGGVSFQPSEFVKYIVPAYFINRVLFHGEGLFWKIGPFLKLIGTICIPILLIVIEPNNGTAAVIAMTAVILCLLTRIPLKYWALPLLVLAVVSGAFASQLPYVKARLNVYLHPEQDLRGKGHQPYQAKIAVGSGGLLGQGPGNSLQKLSYLPEAQNDYIAAIYAEEFGFIGILILVTLYIVLACAGFYIALSSVDLAGFYLASAIVFLICFQAFLNLGVVSGMLPSTGLNLPFFSQGGSSLIVNLIAIGLLLDINAICQVSDRHLATG